MWEFFMSRGVKYDLLQQNDILLQTTLEGKYLSSYDNHTTLFTKNGDIKEWVKDFIRQDAKSEVPVIFKINSTGKSFYRNIYADSGEKVEDLDKLVTFIKHEFKERSGCLRWRYYWKKSMEQLRNDHIKTQSKWSSSSD